MTPQALRNARNFCGKSLRCGGVVSAPLAALRAAKSAGIVAWELR